MAELAPIFLDKMRVRLPGEPNPKVARIVYAAGKESQRIQVQRLQRQEDQQGEPLRMEDAIDRTESSKPVYLHLIKRPNPENGSGSPPARPPGPGPGPKP